jgi:dTDP-4-amino-4,6-dideoxygalactose transaminase
MKEWIVPLTETTLDETEVEAAARVIRSGWLTMGSEVRAFEEEFAASIGTRHAIAVSNGTDALHLAYEAAGLGPDDEFCLPALTFIATLHAGLFLGARPVLVDCASEDDLTMCPEDLERKITDRTKLIVTVPYGGFLPDMERINAIAAERRIPVIEDACHAPLAAWRGRCAGAWGLAGTWSFYGNKNLTTGEGGMITTDDDDVLERCRLTRSHGMTSLTWERHHAEKAGLYEVRRVGWNDRLDEIPGGDRPRAAPQASRRDGTPAPRRPRAARCARARDDARPGAAVLRSARRAGASHPSRSSPPRCRSRSLPRTPERPRRADVGSLPESLALPSSSR